MKKEARRITREAKALKKVFDIAREPSIRWLRSFDTCPNDNTIQKYKAQRGFNNVSDAVFIKKYKEAYEIIDNNRGVFETI